MKHLIAPSQIESELEKIWDSLQGTNKMRASLFNLIIYTTKDKRTDYLKRLSQEIIKKFPSRIIFITFDPKNIHQELQVTASVITAEKAENEIACDLIEINTSTKHHKRVPLIILPHIIPDLPIYIVHGDDPSLSNMVIDQLEAYADRIIFDSESSLNLSAFEKAILHYKKKSKADIADLSWGKIEEWRELFSEFFRSKEHLTSIKQSKTIELTYQKEESQFYTHNVIQPIFFQGWIATELGWSLKKIQKNKQSLHFFYDREGGEVDIVLKPSLMKGVPSGRILSVEIKDHLASHFTFKRNPKCPTHIIIEKTTSSICFLPMHYVLQGPHLMKSLVKEICHTGTSKHYLRMMSYLSQIKEGDLL